MKQNTFIVIVIGLVVVCAVVVAALNLQSLLPSSDNTAGQTNANILPAKADVLEKFDALKAKVNASGMWFGGAGLQNIKSDQTALVYIYKDSSVDPSEQLGAGFSALYSTFETEDPLLVGLVDTGEKLTAEQYKVDVYSLERPFVELYVEGNTTRTELMKKAIYVTPQSESIRPNNSTAKPSVSALPQRTRNFTPPADRQAYVTDYMNNTSYKPMSLQAGTATDGEKMVSLALLLPDSPTNAVKYDGIETALKACTEAYGDYDRYLITLTPSDGSQYVVADAAALPAYDYLSGDISQYELYNNMNLTYYTK
jgi:hypothetical protein